MISKAYINVAVTLPIMKTYTYSLPDHLKDGCSIGTRVLVLFGKRRVTAYVVSFQEHCEGFVAKPVLEIMDAHPLFPAHELSFFQWISEYYIHPLGEVIKAALPSGLDRHDISYVFLTDKGKEQFLKKELPPQKEKIIAYLYERNLCTLKQISTLTPKKTTSSLIRSMEKENLISVSAILRKDGSKVKMEKYLQINGVPDKMIKMSKKRTRILSMLKDKKEVSLSALKQKIPTAPRLVKPLADAGYIKILKRQVFRDPLGDPVEPDTPPALTQDQKKVVAKVLAKSGQGFCPFLLSGVTGSGKTEVYMRLVHDAVGRQKTAIALVPEISLISQTERRFRARFGEKIAVIHSALTNAERLDQWRKIMLKKVDIVIGARSAIFAPLENIGVIIVDEEHDGSYKQETGLRYNARDLAVVRAKQSECPVILGSATPSVQSYQNVTLNRFEELKLEKRINQYPLPKIETIDLKAFKDIKGDDRIITPALAKEIKNCLTNGNQSLIFLNRRGYSTHPVCRDCGKSLLCKFCDVTMTFHKTSNTYQCHLCGFERHVKTRCPECRSKKIKPLGFGTQKIESKLKSMFPEARLARMDQDSTSRKGSTIKILKNIRNRNVDIIVGTQMLAKGHDFPSITLVGIVCADLSLSLPDFRAGERTFQLLAQVAGRAGRGNAPGKVIMQTFNPEHFIIKASKKQDFLEFFHNEIPFRKALSYPPFSRLIQLKISGDRKNKVRTYAHLAGNILNDMIKTGIGKDAVQILGPIESPIQRISSRFRWQILIKGNSFSQIRHLVKSLMDEIKQKPVSGVRMAVDVDPYFLM